jgi:hypothetical protein
VNAIKIEGDHVTIWRRLCTERAALMKTYADQQAALPQDQRANAILQSIKSVVSRIYRGNGDLVYTYFSDFL